MSDSVELASKVLAVLAALLGLAGYILVLGATILWFRLEDAGLPHEVPISLAGREELIATGAQAVAVWLLLVVVLGGLAVWIVTGDPERRHFKFREAALAIAVTVSAVLALDSSAPGVVAVPCLVTGVIVVGSVWKWPSGETVMATVLPAVLGLGLAFALTGIPGNGVAEAVGATFIFSALLLVTPHLQEWRARQEANGVAVAQIEARAEVTEGEAEEEPSEEHPLIKALEQKGRPEKAPDVVTWIRRVAPAIGALLVLGAIAVASQVERDENFHEALVSLANGDCVVGTYIARGGEQIVLAQPSFEDTKQGEEAPRPRITTIPTKEVLEVQVYGKAIEGADLVVEEGCAASPRLVKPKEASEDASADANAPAP